MPSRVVQSDVSSFDRSIGSDHRTGIYRSLDPGIQDNDLTDSIPVGIPRLLSAFVRVCTDECGVRYPGGLIGRPTGTLTPR